MNYLKNYNDYIAFVKEEIKLGKRPKNKLDYANKDAAIWAHGSAVSKCTISFCCKGKRNIALGYHWEYVEVQYAAKKN